MCIWIFTLLTPSVEHFPKILHMESILNGKALYQVGLAQCIVNNSNYLFVMHTAIKFSAPTRTKTMIKQWTDLKIDIQ